ncbi:hypothetical protein MMC27_000856 [Xylographa pallens]|nr:hypothetical protein [Xylographa pallens]
MAHVLQQLSQAITKKLQHMLLEAGADITQGIKSGKMHIKPTKHLSTLLPTAIRDDHNKTDSFLLANKADPKAIGISWGTPITLAVQKGQGDVVSMLLAYGANINKPDGRECSPLVMSIQYCREDLVRLLIEKERNIQATGWKLSHSTIYMGLEQTVQLLIEKGADVHETSTSYGYTLLHYAAMNRQEKAMRILLEGGVDVQATTADGDTALH